jgi:hypothetical protein
MLITLLNMGRTKFRIIRYNDGDVTYYETKVKSWFGWIPFSVFYKTNVIHIITDPSDEKSMAYERIYQYCRVKGYEMKDISITEIVEDRTKK